MSFKPGWSIRRKPPGNEYGKPLETSRWSAARPVLSEVRGPSLEPYIRAGSSASGWRNALPEGARRRISTGLILVRTPRQSKIAQDRSGGKSEYQAVMIKGRLTYAFNEFVHTKYPTKGNYKRNEAVANLAKHMTIEERLVINTLDFNQIWQYYRGGSIAGNSATTDYSQVFAMNRTADNSHATTYAFRRSRFVETWLSNKQSADTLRLIMETAKGVGDSRWEFPKGKRASKDESDIDCAIREFTEETGIPPQCYRVIPNFCRIDIYTHMGSEYIISYFMAILEEPIEDPSNGITLYSKDQISEVADVQWMGMERISHVKGPAGRDISHIARSAFSYAKKYMRCREPKRADYSQQE